MMSKSWAKSVIKDIEFISDKNLQNDLWEKSKIRQDHCFEALIDSLYDDGDFEHLIEYCSGNSHVTNKQINMLKELYKKLDDYSYKTEIYNHTIPDLKVDEKKVLADPEWHEIQKLAKEVMVAFKDFPL